MKQTLSSRLIIKKGSQSLNYHSEKSNISVESELKDIKKSILESHSKFITGSDYFLLIIKDVNGNELINTTDENRI
jgi:hypothetical protein